MNKTLTNIIIISVILSTGYIAALYLGFKAYIALIFIIAGMPFVGLTYCNNDAEMKEAFKTYFIGVALFLLGLNIRLLQEAEPTTRMSDSTHQVRR